MAGGFVLELTSDEVVLGIDHQSSTGPADDDISRIDKDEIARVRNYLAHLFYTDGDARRPRLVVDLRAPHFSDPTPPFAAGAATTMTNGSQLTQGMSSLPPHLARLSPSQLAAMSKVLAADDYAWACRGRARQRSSPHSFGSSWGAVADLPTSLQVHPDVRKYTLDSRRKATTVEQLILSFLGGTLSNYCTVDEAFQITIPTCLGPLRCADTFVLVGDLFQLPPLTKNYDARTGGLDASLFRRLSEVHPEAVVDLRFQYRMNKDIMKLRINWSIRTVCDFLKRLHGSNKSKVCGDSSGNVANEKNYWLEKPADESCKSVSVDTDALPAFDSRVGDLVQNTTEAELVRQLTEAICWLRDKASRFSQPTKVKEETKVV
ncbi:hypothetical protein D9619_010521 [Psilocybe cf. subviscida]|uniref:DNA replication ATP-dependent helicase/nuclease n=1 Tax=Psilocybe cf. subviscida TaxID=2480587 RepID=A0A8H5AS12_9AGAR|nr:hypothetical protein D9619_010521 [Psilocybe cf. subviscida]